MNVVIVDDDRALLRSLEILLTQQRHRVAAFGNPRDAADYLRQGGSPDVLLVDYFLGRHTGADLLAKARASLSAKCLVLLMSAHTEQLDRRSLRRFGIDDVLPKPLNLDELCRIIEAG